MITIEVVKKEKKKITYCVKAKSTLLAHIEEDKKRGTCFLKIVTGGSSRETLKFASLDEAKSFLDEHCSTRNALISYLSEVRCAAMKSVPCAIYFDSKYDFKRCRGGWHIYNSSDYNPCSVGTIARGKYGAHYWLRIGGVIVAQRSDLSELKKLALTFLNGEKNISDSCFAFWYRYFDKSICTKEDW